MMLLTAIRISLINMRVCPVWVDVGNFKAGAVGWSMRAENKLKGNVVGEGSASFFQ